MGATQRLAVFTAAFAPCLSHLCEVKTFTFHSEDTITECAQGFSAGPQIPHLEGTNRSFPLSFTSYDDSSLAVVLLGCVPQRDQIAAHRPQSANTRESIKQWRCHHSNGYWGQLVPCDHQATLCKGHPKSKLQTQFLVFERFETFIRKESLFPLYDNRHWVTPHTFTSVRNKCWPWHSVCTGSTQSDT